MEFRCKESKWFSSLPRIPLESTKDYEYLGTFHGGCEGLLSVLFTTSPFLDMYFIK